MFIASTVQKFHHLRYAGRELRQQSRHGHRRPGDDLYIVKKRWPVEATGEEASAGGADARAIPQQRTGYKWPGMKYLAQKEIAAIHPES